MAFQQQRKIRYRKPRRSLRTILLSWFLVLSLAPLMFVTGYSLVKYEQGIDTELVDRLRGNAREFESIVGDFETFLKGRRDRYRTDPMLSYYLLTNAIAQAKARVESNIRNTSLSSLSLFNREGQLVASLTPIPNGEQEERNLEDASIFLSDYYKQALQRDGAMTVAENGANHSIDLISITRLEAKAKGNAGYIEEIINLGPGFLENIKKRLNLEVILFDEKGQIVGGSHADFGLYDKSMFAKTIRGNNLETFFDLTVRNEPFRFIATPVKWGQSTFLVGLGASKQRSKGILRNVNYAFFGVICGIGILFIIIAIFATRVLVRPVYELVEAIQMMEVKDGPVEIPVTTDTEFGLLTESFNDMSRRIYQTKMELEKKVAEVERAYSELKDAQTRLVHSAKMVSLGQMVAGIAHELNNPIGFIYSNMSHLRDYSEKLKSIIEAGEKSPAALEDAKQLSDYKYIIEDLPRLISSCEDGARRTRDIVLGLRNFSRLEEAKIKRVSLKEGIENTLNLLSGELKNRIKVHPHFEIVPEVLCYPSQLNQVFMNILTNAAQAIDGEGDIWIHLHKVGDGPKAKAVVEIKDSGQGISKEGLEKIFDPFYTTKSVGQGTGLGLSISYGIVKAHGGDLTVKSEPGKGTQFTISVPIEGPPAAKAQKA